MGAASELELDLDVFAGPFDLLMTIVLREEIALAEVELGEIVIAYLDHVEEQGELDLEAATEFLVLIASLLELKSRLLLPAPEEDEIELGPEEAAEELLARMLEYRRYRDAAPTWPSSSRTATATSTARRRCRRSCAASPRRRASRPTSPTGSGPRSAICCACRRAPDTSHIRPTVSLEKRLRVLRELLVGRGSLDFDEAFGNEDRLTQAVTLFALLELHKQGEATWEQSERVRRRSRRW